MSHTPGINKTDPTCFPRICTGSGPIQNTIGNLNGGFDEDLWQLFCSELEDFVHVESLSGGPYRRMEGIGIRNQHEEVPMVFHYRIHRPLKYNLSTRSNPLSVVSLKYSLTADFTRYLLKEGGLPMGFIDGNYYIGMPYIDCTLYLSDKFIGWYNREDNPYRKVLSLEQLTENRILIKHLIKDGKLYASCTNNTIHEVEEYEGNLICTFKGSPVLRHIFTQEDVSEDNLPLLLHHDVVQDIVEAIINVVNYRYGRKKEEQPESGGQAIYL